MPGEVVIPGMPLFFLLFNDTFKIIQDSSKKPPYPGAKGVLWRRKNKRESKISSKRY